MRLRPLYTDDSRTPRVGAFRSRERRAPKNTTFRCRGRCTGSISGRFYRGYGRAYPQGRRQVVGAAWHVTDGEGFRSLNDATCAITGEVRAPTPELPDGRLVFDVAEIAWEAPPD